MKKVIPKKINLEKEIVLYGFLNKEINMPEYKISKTKGISVKQPITSSKDQYEFLKRVYGRKIELQEQLIILFFDQAGFVVGYYKHTIGARNRVLLDTSMILGIALKSGCLGFTVSHNHPSGVASPSQADIDMTKAISKASKTVGVRFYDHIIVAKDRYYSFYDVSHSALSGVDNKVNDNYSFEDKVRLKILENIKKVTKQNNPKVFEILNTEKGYIWVEKKIIDLVVNNGIKINSAIPFIELELGDE